MEAVWVALIVAVIGPGFLDWRRNKRLDLVAERTAQVARTLETANATTNQKLDVIHELVNSQMTAAKQEALDATVMLLASLKELIDIKQTAGHQPSVEVLAAVETAEAKACELRLAISDRVKD